MKDVNLAKAKAMLSELVVATAVPFADGTAWARHRIGHAHEGNDEVASAESTGGVPHAPEGFVADDEPLVARGR